MNNCCKKEDKKIINKGAKCTINVTGDKLVEGDTYTAVLYYDARNSVNRAMAQAIAEVLGDSIMLIFEFSSEETDKLKVGPVIFEFYSDEEKELSYIENFAQVRATSLSN